MDSGVGLNAPLLPKDPLTIPTGYTQITGGRRAKKVMGSQIPEARNAIRQNLEASYRELVPSKHAWSRLGNKSPSLKSQHTVTARSSEGFSLSKLFSRFLSFFKKDAARSEPQAAPIKPKQERQFVFNKDPKLDDLPRNTRQKIIENSRRNAELMRDAVGLDSPMLKLSVADIILGRKTEQ